MKTLKLSRYIESFFIVRLTKQKKYSMNTIESYQATFRLFLDFICKKLKKRHFQLVVEDINVRLVNDFLDYLEIQRKSSARTRNLRISAIKSFFNFLNEQLPELSELFGQILAIPQKRTNRKLIGYLNNKEVKAILASPDQSTFIGRRDHILILILIHTGCRLSELIELRWRDVHLSDGAYIDFFGKGRKERRIPLSKQLKERLLLWSKEIDSSSTDIVFPTIHKTLMSSDAIQYLIKKYSAIAVKKNPSLNDRKISPHTLRHTAAMRMLSAGADLSSIALFLGHESVETTYIYLSMDMTRMEKILKKIPIVNPKITRYRPKNTIMRFLSDIVKKTVE